MTLRPVLLLFLFIAAPVLGVTQVVLPGPDKVPDRDEISAAIARFGEIPVLVTLAVAIRAEHELTGAEQAHQRQQIRQAQLAVRRALPAGAMREYQTMPLMRLVVTAETLQLLTTLPEVASVVEDRLSAPELATSVAQIHAPYLWRQGFTGSGHTIVVLDTGAEITHPFLADNIVAEACFSTTYAEHGATSLCPGGVASAFTTGSSADCDPAVFGCGHGTHVAGIAAGRTSDRYGVAPEANIIPIQVFSRFDNASFCGGADRSPCVLTYTSDILAALEASSKIAGESLVSSNWPAELRSITNLP
jgi:subtilisin family serine protease